VDQAFTVKEDDASRLGASRKRSHLRRRRVIKQLEAARKDSDFHQEILEIPCVLSAAREDIFLAETG
jgi:hypothetical protein